MKKIGSRDKVKVLFRPKNGHISAASNSALELVTGDFITFLDHDDLLHRHALTTIVAYINSSPATDIFYSDEDKVDVSGSRFEPHFKPEWSPELLLSQNYICHMSVYRRAIIESLGGFKEGVEGAQDYDLILRATEVTENITRIPHVLYHWRATKGSTALSQDQKDYANKKSVDVLKNALLRRNLDAKVLETGLGVYHRVQYNLSSPPPSVSIIIPTRNRVDLLKVCVEGITEKTDYPNLEIIVVDNNSDEGETQNYLAALKQTGVYVFEEDGDFNFSAINNFAVSKASGDINFAE